MVEKGGSGGCVQCLKTNLLTMLTAVSVVAGIGFGFVLRTREAPWTEREIMYIDFPGNLFLRMLKCIILPLIVSSLVSALGGLDLQLSGRIGTRAVVYYMVTTLCAVILGIILVVSIHPGQGDPGAMKRVGTSRNITVADTLLDLVRNLVPPNLIEACIFQYRTVLTYPGPKTIYLDLNATNLTGPVVEVDNVTKIETQIELPMTEWQMSADNSEGTNILGLVMFCVILGVALSHMREKGKPLYNLFACLNNDAHNSLDNLVITDWDFFLIASKIIEMKDFGVVIGQLGMYTITVIVGLFIHGFIILPLLYSIITRTLPFRFIFNMLEALITAFGTASSSATLPVAIACLEEKNGVDTRVARFVLPIGATINMDGTALYEAVAALFIAQVRSVPMDVGKIIAVSITATAASIGAAGIPQAGLVTMVMVLNAVGLPAEDVTLIIVVDWF
uniref:Amino acid transporter n=1 Tax=Strigamia maritima TaxID=126957 RepID=T1J434_STRMM